MLELLVAIIVMSLVMMGVYCIQIFSDNQVVTSNRKAAMQNEVSFILEHMSKQLNQAIGDGSTYPVNYDTGDYFQVWIDSDHDGIFNATSDKQIYYHLTGAGAVEFCENATSGGKSCAGFTPEVLSKHIINFPTAFTINNATNLVYVNLTACWDPAQVASCGSLKNPSVTMSTCIFLPSVASN